MSDLHDRTFFPPAEEKVLRELEEFINSFPAALLRSPEGHETLIPEEVYGALRDVVEALRRGQAITVAPHDTVLTTQEAADLLGISRPTFVKILERGEVAYTKPGRHRRVLLSDVLAYQRRSSEATRRGLDELVAISEEAGLYDDVFLEPPSRR